MSIKQWYTVLLEDKVTMNTAHANQAASLIPLSVETLYPNSDWNTIWKMVRMKGLGSDLISFKSKMVHRQIENSKAGQCLLCREVVEDIVHCFFDSPNNLAAGVALLGCVQQVCPGLSPE